MTSGILTFASIISPILRKTSSIVVTLRLIRDTPRLSYAVIAITIIITFTTVTIIAIVVLFIMSTCDDSKASNMSGKTLEEEVGSKIST